MKEGYINIPIEHFDTSTTPTVTSATQSFTPNVTSTPPRNVTITPTTNIQNKSIKLYVWTETENDQTILKYSTHNTKLSGLHLSIREKNNNTIKWSSEQGNAEACDWFVKINNFNSHTQSIPESTQSIPETTQSIPESTPSSSSESFYNFEPFQATVGGNTTTNSVIESTNSVIGTTASAVIKEITAKVILLYNGEDFDTLASNSVNSKNKENILGKFDGEFEIVEIIGASDNNNQDIIKEELSGGPPVSDPQTTTTGVPQTTTTVGCITRKIIKSLVIKYYNPSIRDNDVERTKIRKQIKKYVIEWYSYRLGLKPNPNNCTQI